MNINLDIFPHSFLLTLAKAILILMIHSKITKNLSFTKIIALRLSNLNSFPQKVYNFSIFC